MKGGELLNLLITDKTPRKIVGSHYKLPRPALDKLKRQIAENINNQITFDEIYELNLPEGRVLMFQIPKALCGMPTAWRGHFYGRDGESLGALSLNEMEEIRGQVRREDWSVKICEGATLKDLAPAAIRFAREEYKKKYPKLVEEINKWNDLTFLNKAKVCINGRITKTAIVLLGKGESEHLLSPAHSQLTWIIKDKQGIEKDYKHFGPPLILAVNQVYGMIRNLTYRYMASATLFPSEIKQYDPWVIRETLHNCIAHQDYTLAGRINIVEEPDSLFFTNLGYFIPGSVEELILRDAPPEWYRNPFLAHAMVNLNMIDTIGSGIKRMFLKQQQRFFPLPDYDLSEPERVKVRLFGEVLDENYTRLLIKRTRLDLLDVIALDKVQKKRPLTEEEFKSIKKQKLIEGRRPNLYVAAKIAAVTGKKAIYIKHRAFDKAYYKEMIVAYLKKFNHAKREDINNLLMNKLSDALMEKQKRNLIGNLLFEMAHKDMRIIATGSRRAALWRLRDDIK